MHSITKIIDSNKKAELEFIKNSIEVNKTLSSEYYDRLKMKVCLGITLDKHEALHLIQFVNYYKTKEYIID